MKKIAFIAALALAASLAVVPSAHAATGPFTDVDSKTIATGGTFPIDIVQAKNGNLYVLDHAKPVVNVVNPKTGKQIKTIKLTSSKTFETAELAVLGNKVYALDEYLNKLFVIDATKNKVTKTVKLKETTAFSDPEVLAASNNGKYIYLGSHSGTEIQALNTKTNKITKHFDLSAILDYYPAEAEVTTLQVVAIACSDNDRYLYLSLEGTFAEDSFAFTAIYDTKKLKVTAVDAGEAWGTPNTKFYDIVNIGGGKVYRSVSTEVTDGKPFYIDVLDLSNPNKIVKVATINLPKNNVADKLLYSNGYLFATNPDQDGFTKYLPSPNTVQVIDTKTNKVVGSFKSTKTIMPIGIVSNDGKKLYFINGGSPDKGWKGQITTVNLLFPTSKITGANTLILHKSASMSSKTVGYVHKGEKVKVLKVTKTNWAKVKIGKRTGWIPKKYLK
ncbi:MAG: SH3 domain-containing protein [Propionibacteriaceae bacterium]|nr:SH3 domain-containing protein [Propionibacteriaceae bacterium]